MISKKAGRGVIFKRIIVYPGGLRIRGLAGYPRSWGADLTLTRLDKNK